MKNAPTTPQVTPTGLELADHLEHLVELPLSSQGDIEPWDSAGDEVRTWLDIHIQELPFELPHHLMHYFMDSDIRVKDPAYKESQDQAVQHIIRQLRGEAPLDIRRPWWRLW